jgi:hypothetical protein
MYMRHTVICGVSESVIFFHIISQTAQLQIIIQHKVFFYFLYNFCPEHCSLCRPGSSVSIASGYGWTVQGSKPSGDEIFRTCLDWSWGPPSLLNNGYRVFPGARKWPGHDINPSPHSSAEVSEHSVPSL